GPADEKRPFVYVNKNSGVKAYSLLGPAFEVDAYYFSDYDEKQGSGEQLFAISDSSENNLQLEEAFLPEVREHNNKSLRGTTLEESRFKDRSFRLNKNFSFVPYAQMELPAGKTLEDNFVLLGGRKSHFKMTVEALGESKDLPGLLNRAEPSSTKLLLLSDAALLPDYGTSCLGVFGDTNPVRFVRRTFQTKERVDFYGRPAFSELSSFLARGSLLVLKESVDINTLCHPDPALDALGYNSFLSL
ncbi:MAG: hypothetical protein KDC44_16865, partial [Phaeodactylibacter sp.]|nr:hypothetical protein [Phaeodactylibacter sp.]